MTGASPYALTTEMHDGVAVVTFDVPGAPVNTFTRAVRDEFGALIERLEKDESVRAVVMISGKPDSFIAGADIEELVALRTATDAERLSREGQAMIDRLERGKPIVAAINGACMGGGLESAIAFAYRIATDNPKTVLALPEVQLGLIPGAGGTQRLPRLVGLAAAGVFSAQQPISIGWRFSPTRWLAILLLFVLARVFEQGARMREDLEGTV